MIQAAECGNGMTDPEIGCKPRYDGGFNVELDVLGEVGRQRAYIQTALHLLL